MDVALFVTCLTDTFFPRAGEAVVRVLRHFGCRVRFPPEQTCCGQPAFNSGFRDEATVLARRMIEIFEPYDTIVCPSASCAGMMREHYPGLFTGEEAWHGRARRLATRTHEFVTFLRDRLDVDITACLKFDEPVTFHYPCHARGIYSAADLQDWLSAAGHIELRVPEHPDMCCGFGGMFAVEHADISGAMLDDKLDVLAATGARLVVCNESGCTMQIAGGARRRGIPLRFKHIAECLAESLGLMEPQ
ncbi:MAG: (Fe-S)-binding protein [Planctomycetota bacterium]